MLPDGSPLAAYNSSSLSLGGVFCLLTLTELTNSDTMSSTCRRHGIEPSRREEYLSDEEFQTVFGMTKVDFAKEQKWKRDRAKKAKGLS